MLFMAINLSQRDDDIAWQHQRSRLGYRDSLIICSKLPINRKTIQNNSKSKPFKRIVSIVLIPLTSRDSDGGEQATACRDSGEQTTLKNQRISLRCVGCQLNSDQAHRLLCLKGHVRVRGSTL